MILSLLWSVGPQCWKTYRFRGTQTLIVVTHNVIAVKRPRAYATFIPRRECVDFYPYGLVFSTDDGLLYSLSEMGMTGDAKNEACTFIFAECWPHIDRDTFMGIITQSDVDGIDELVRIDNHGRGRMFRWGVVTLVVSALASLWLGQPLIAVGMLVGIVVLDSLQKGRAQHRAWRNFEDRARAVCIALNPMAE